LVVLPADWAWDFLLFCQRNPKPCPILDVIEAGSVEPAIARGADLRTDLPGYRIWKQGELIQEASTVMEFWSDNLVSFLIGCSFTFEAALLTQGIPIRHIEQKVNVPMYRTNRDCLPAGRFWGNLVVSMRPLLPGDALRATQVCARYPRAHGAPVHLGDPQALGITDLAKPDYGDAVTIYPGEVPVFWACGVTPQAALLAARPPFAITHQPGHMFLTDLRDHDLEDA
jgi:uncharacterized protein YcsI (UPF0317 family)